MAKHDLTLVILAGGKGERMKPLNYSVPKSLLSTFDEPILIRQLRQAKNAGIVNIIVSTNPKDTSVIKKAISASKINAKTIGNRLHSKGTLPALNFILNKLSTKYILMSFADIYFFQNPFKVFCNKSVYTLGISNAFDDKELSLGGIVLINKSHVKKIVERPFKNKKGYRWNGLAFFCRSEVTNLSAFLKRNKLNSPEGDFFEYLRRTGKASFSFVKCLDFININNPENLLVASIYRFSEASKNSDVVSLANRTRTIILNKA